MLERADDEALAPEVEEALTHGGDRPVVHLTFGTVYVNPEDLRRTAAAIAELDVVLIVAGSIDQAIPGVVTSDYLPHHLLLPRCSAVVSHGGAGVMLKSLVPGLPQVGVPKGAGSDQLRTAMAFERAGAGLCVAAEDATPESIAAATSSVLGQPSYATTARRISDEIAAMPSHEVVARRLAESFADR